MNLLLAVDAPQWVLFGVLVLVIILAPIFMGMRNKKEMVRRFRTISRFVTYDHLKRSCL